MTSTKKGVGVITIFWGNLQMVVDGVLGGEIFLALLSCTNPKRKSLPFHQKSFFIFYLFNFFFTFDCCTAFLKFILQLICSSITETRMESVYDSLS